MSAYTEYYLAVKERNDPVTIPYRRYTGCIGFYNQAEAVELAHTLNQSENVEYVNMCERKTGKIWARFYE